MIVMSKEFDIKSFFKRILVYIALLLFSKILGSIGSTGNLPFLTMLYLLMTFEVLILIAFTSQYCDIPLPKFMKGDGNHEQRI